MNKSSVSNEQWPLLLAGSLCLSLYGYWMLQTRQLGAVDLTGLLAVSGACTLVTLITWRFYQKQATQMSVVLVVGFALLFRVVAVFCGPILEDDYYRYLWDGWTLVEQGTPYGIAPAAYFGVDTLPMGFDDVLDGINHPQIATVYGPVAQWFFAAAHLLAPGSVTALQVLFGTADMLVLIFLLRLAPVHFCFLYGWSALLIKEFAGSAHLDVLGAMFLVLALVLYRRQLWLLLGVALGLATGVKIFALIVAPFLLGWQWRAWCTFLPTLVVVALPFGLYQAWLPEGLQAMARGWLFNSPVYQTVFQISGPEIVALARPVLLVGFSGVWIWQYVRWMRYWIVQTPAEKKAPDLSVLPHHWLFGVFLLCLPVINPWYLVWWLPFVVLRPNVTAWVASVALFLSYVSGINLAGNDLALYQHPSWLLWVEFGAIAIAVLVDRWLSARGVRARMPADH